MSLQQARAEKKGLRILLRVEAPELASLPWEYLYDKAEGDFFCLSTETPLVRYLELARPPEALSIEPPLNILGMIASPADLPRLDVEKEKALMTAGVEHLIEKGLIRLSWLEGQSWRDLQTALRNDRWHMLHFIGHGAFDDQTGEGAIALCDDYGRTYQLTASSLGRLLAGHRSMRLVVLNACEGARGNELDLFSSTGASLIRKGIPAAVSMQYEISDGAALEFSRAFYEAIAEAHPVDTALQEARKAISLAQQDAAEWGTPTLHMRAPNGRLFDLEIGKAIFSGTKAQANVGVDYNKFEPAPPSEKDAQQLKILHDKVRQFWVKGVLEQSVQHAALIKLELDNMPDMVDNPWGSMPIETDQSIGEVFDKTGHSLLILGEPGAGKTILLLTLARELLDRCQKQAGMALPVVFNLSSWSHSTKTLSAWLADELSAKYMIPRKIGKKWIEDHRLLLLLDG